MHFAIGKRFSLNFIWLAVVCANSSYAAPVCDPPNASIVFSTQVNVSGHDRLRVFAPVPSYSDLIVTAAAVGIDVHLELVPESGSSPLIADTPIRRKGPQHLITNVGNHTAIQLEIVGKEHPGAHGSVQVNIFRLSDLQDAPGCVSGYTLMSTGDSHYAKAELISTENKGASGDAREEYAAAAKAYQSAVSALLSAGPGPSLATAYLSEAATLYQGLQRWTDAQQAALLAESTSEAAGDEYGMARARAMEAAANVEIALSARSDNAQGPRDRASILNNARRAFLGVAALHRRRHEPYDEALALNNIGLSFYYEGDYQHAIGAYSQAELIYARLKEKPRDAQVRQNLALVEYELGRFSNAKRDYAEALSLIDHYDNPKLYAEILNNRALAEYVSGDLDAALQHYSAALTILTDVQVTREQARSLHGIGAVYYAVGDREQAIDYFRRSLSLRSEALDPRGRGASLRSLAGMLSDLNRPSEALALQEQALALSPAASARLRIETQVASELQRLGRHEEARAAAERAISDAGDTFGRALALTQRASLEYEEKSYSKAAADITVAVNTLETAETPTEDFAALLLAAEVSRRQDHEKSAKAFIDRALRVAEEIRTESANPELRAGLWQPIRPAFDLKIRLQIESAGNRTARDRIALATLTIAEQFRARSLKDYQRQDGGSDPARINALYREIADRRAQLEARLDRSPDSDPRVAAIRRDIAGLRRQIDTLSSSSIKRARAVNVATSAGTDSIETAVETIPADVTVIEYWLGQENAWAWVIARGKVRMVNLGASKQLETTARDLYASLGDFSNVSAAERQRLAAKLYALAIDPLPADALRKPNLIIIPDGALHYIPFAVLKNSDISEGDYLIERHAVASAPSLAALYAIKDRKGKQRTDRVLIVSDPVYSPADERVLKVGRSATAESASLRATSLTIRSGAGGDRLDRLPGTAREAQAITALFAPEDIESLSGLDASREAFLSRDLSRYRIIHVAAHAISDLEAPRLSTLVFSTVDQNGRSIPGNVFSGELLLTKVNAEVFVLSACNTAVGREVAGEGLLGLRYAALAAGAKSVVASMWRLPDRPAAELMSAFYAHLVRDHAPPARALAEAIREVRLHFQDPALWGAFDVSLAGRDSLTAYIH